DVTIKPANNEEIGLTPEGKTNNIPFEVSVNGKTNEVKPNVVVQLDADGNGTADEDEKSKPAEDVKALNQNKVDPETKKVTDQPKDTTTVTGKAKPGSTVIIKNESGDQIGKVEKIGEDGTFTAEVTKQEEGKKVKVVVTEPGKQDSDPVETTVVRDSDNDGQDDTKAGVTERPAAIASNKGKNPAFTTIEGKTEKGATITVTVKVNGEEKPVAVENFVNDDGTYTLEAKY
ncbi:Ig-like domain-containing protein, partial [Peptoniphilus genitalis]